MKVIKSDYKKTKKVKLKINSLDDLWHLSHIIDAGDLVTSKTTRKIVSDKDQRKKQVSKKTVTLTNEVERVEFHKTADILRIIGKVRSEHKDIPKNSYHTISIEVDDILVIQKKDWKNFQIKKIKEYSDRKVPNVLICLIDREMAVFGILKDTTVEYLSEIKGNVPKKYDVSMVKNNTFYADTSKQLLEYVKRFEPYKIILAGPSFFKEDFLDVLKGQEKNIEKKTLFAECYFVSENALNDVISRPEVKTVLKESRLVQDTEVVDQLFRQIATEEKVTYGFSHVKEANDMGAISVLVVTDDYIHSLRQNEAYDPLDKLMTDVEKRGGKVHILDSRTMPGEKVDGLGGIAAMLRFETKT